MILHEYPYADNHEMNLDWIISQTNEMIGSNKSLKYMVEEAEDTMDTKTLDFTSRVNQHTLALEALTNTINTHIGAITNVGNNIATDIEFLGWAVPRECPIQNYIDAQGRFHQRVNRLDLSGLNWDKNGNTNIYYATISDMSFGDIYISKYEYIEDYAFSTPNGHVSNYHAYPKLIFIHDDNYTTLNDFTNSLTGLYVYYKLETENVYNVGQEKVFRTAAQIYGLSLSDVPSSDEIVSDNISDNISDIILSNIPGFMPDDVPLGVYVEPTESYDEEVTESDDEEVTESDDEE